MPRTHELAESRAAKVAEMRALLDAAGAAKRDLNEEEAAKFEKTKTEVAALDTQIARQRFMDEQERRMDGQPVDGAARDRRSLAARFSVAKAVREHSEGKLSGVEAEWQTERRSGRPDALSIPTACILGGGPEQRATQLVGDLTKGGYMVDTDVGPVIDRLKPVLAVERLGATVLRDLDGFLTLPKITQGATAYWVGEHEEVTRSTVLFGEIQMAPNTVGAELEVSRRLMIQTNEVIEQILRRELGYVLSQALDTAAIAGSGGIQPQGIVGDASIPSGNILSLGAAGGSPTIDTPAQLMGLVEDLNAPDGNSGFLTNSKVRRTLSLIKDGNDRPYTEAEIWRGERVVISNNVPSTYSEGASGAVLSAIIYSSAWSELVIGYWSNIDILLNPYHSDVASRGGFLLHAFLDVDIALKHGEAFSYTIEAITT